jgi:hypothetical protein
VPVTVTHPSNGTSPVNPSVSFAYAAAVIPIVQSVSRIGGPAAGGTSVTVTGMNFTGATAVHFGANAATSVTVVSATKITCASPAGSNGTVHVTVTTPNGTSATSISDQFIYAPVPSVTSIAPTGGSTAGGTSVTITGSGFTNATFVIFGNVNANSFTVNSDSSITATSSAQSAGTVHVQVCTAGGNSSPVSGDQFTYS